MKIYFLLLLFFTVVCIEAQRRTTAKPDASPSSTQRTVSRGRGRSRFVATPDYLENNDVVKPSAEIPSRRASSRRRQEEAPPSPRATPRTTVAPRKSSYAVEENVNEEPIDYFKKSPKGKTFSEANYDVPSSRRNSVTSTQFRTEAPAPELPESTENLVSNSIIPESPIPQSVPSTELLEEQQLDTTLKTNTLDLPSEISQEEIKDFTKSVAQSSTTAKPVEPQRSQNGGSRRNNIRSRVNNNVAENPVTSRVPEGSRNRVRTRAPKKIEQAFIPNTVPVRTPERISRRRPVPSNAVPQVINAEIVQPDFQFKPARKTDIQIAERSPLDSSASKTKDVRRRPSPSASSTAARSTEQLPRRSNGRTKAGNPPSVQTFPSRNAARSRDLPPVIDEQKLEVLPLFENEPKTVRPLTRSRTRERTSKTIEATTKATNRGSRSRGRAKNSVTAEDVFLTSATETDVKFTRPNNPASIVSVSVNVETRTESSSFFKRRPLNKKAQVKESVVSQISEITSKRTIPKRKNSNDNSSPSKTKLDNQKNKIKEKIIASRGNKKSEIRLNEIKRSKGDGSDEIDESDNYPEPFKALIQAKKTQEGETTLVTESPRASTTIGSTNVVTSSSTTPSSVFTIPSSEATKEVNDEDNELDPKRSRKQSLSKLSNRAPRPRSFSSLTRTTPLPPSSKSTPSSYSRSSISTRSFPTRKSAKVARSTAIPPSTSPMSREEKYEGLVTKVTAGFSNLGRGSYRKTIKEKSANKERLTKDVDPILFSTKIPKPVFKKSERYSGKYRSDISLRGISSRSTTNAPVYIPTIPSIPYVPTVPTVTPPTRTRVDTAVGTKDADLGLEVISFDDPVNTIPSANLVKGEFVSTSENIIQPLVKDGTTEKPVSIIERIINSLTAIQTTSTPDPSQTSTVSSTESNSAILKLATKKSAKNDKIFADSNTENIVDRTLTTEKPTTIIEKILSSLNAIQATDDTNSIQVGRDFNTISSSSTTPLPSVTKSLTTLSTLPAQFSTSLDPLSILDEITPEQALQKRTIGKLLDLLNGLLNTSPSPQKLVVVTPKASGLLSSTQTSTRNPSISSNLQTTTAPTSTVVSSTTESPTTLSVTQKVSSEFFTSSPVDSDIASNTVSESDDKITTAESIISTFESIPSTFAPISTTQESLSQVDIEARFGATSEAAVTIPSETSTPDNILTQNSIFSTSTDPITTDISNSQTTTVSSSTFPSTTEIGLKSSTDASSFFTLLSTLPNFQQFRVSPDSVSIFSANDLSNAITPDDQISTITIASRTNFDNAATTQNTITTQSSEFTSYTPTTQNSFNTETIVTSQNSFTTENIATTENGGSTEETLVTTEAGTTKSSSDDISTNLSSVSMDNRNVKLSNTNENSNPTKTSSSPTIADRSGRLLDFVQDPVQNSIDISTPSTTTSTTPDYYVFAVLNNNTILRKKPPTIPNKDTPFVIVGIYPNNTIVRKFPNGTFVPMEEIIRVRGFDTRENPPPLPEITSNQVTNERGGPQDNSNVQTVEQTTPQNFEANALSLKNNISTTTTTVKTPSSMSTTLSMSTSPSTTISTPTTSTTTRSTTTTRTTANTSINPSTTGAISTTQATDTTEQIAATTASSTMIPAETSVPTTVSTVNPSSTVESSTVLSSSSTTESVTLPTLSELLNGKTLEEFNNIFSSPPSIVSTTANTNTLPEFHTLQVNQIESTTSTTQTSSVQPGLATTEANSFTFSNDIIEESSSLAVPADVSVRTSAPFTSVPLRTSAPLSTTSAESLASTTSSETATSTTTPTPSTTAATTTTPRTANPTSSTLVPRLTKTATVTVIPPPRAEVTTPSFLPSFLSTLFPALFTPEVVTIRAPKITLETSLKPTESNELFVVASSTISSTTVDSPRTIKTTTVPSTTVTTTTTERTIITTTQSATTSTTTPSTTTATSPTTTSTAIPTTSTAAPTISVTTQANVPFTDLNTVAEETTPKAPKLKVLTEQQKKDLQTLAELEKEQAALLQQLSFLTSLNFAGNNAKKTANIRSSPNSSNLANRVIQLAVERDRAKPKSKKTKTTTTEKTTTVEQPSTTTTTEQALNASITTSTTTETATTKKTKPTSSSTKMPNSIQDQITAIEATRTPKQVTPSLNIEDVLKQYNLNGLDIATTPKSTKYGTSNDAILASILKEQGIEPSTPKSLEGIFETTKRPRPRTTTPRPGPLMQGLNWLLNVLAPQPTTTTRRPRKPKKPKKPPVSEELLANSPTHITPVITPAPSAANALSQDDIQKLIKQLEGLQKDPSKGSLDLTQIKSLQTLINADEGVQVQANGEHGATSRRTTTERAVTVTTTKRKKPRKTTTQEPILSVSNSLDDVEEEYVTTTVKPKAPIGFKPVPGVDDGQTEPLIRGNLLSAAVNVTRAISGFLGSALQDAAFQFTKMYSNGSGVVRNIFGGSTSLASSASSSISSGSNLRG